MPPRRVLFVHTTSEIGGSDISLAGIVERLDRTRFEPLIALPASGPLVARLEQAGARVFILPRMRKLTSRKGRAWLAVFALNYPAGVASLASLIRRERVDIVHTNTIHNLYGGMAARVAGRAHVWHVREIVWQNRALLKIEQMMAASLSDRVIVTSDAVREAFERGSPRRAAITRVDNGIDVSRFVPGASDMVRRDFGIDPAAPLIGAAARMDIWKGLEDFIEAAAIVRQARPDARFVIAGGAIEGQAAYEQELRVLAQTRGLDGVLFFAGWRYGPEAMPAFHQSIDLLVLPSREPEPFGLVVLEAMAAGKPVIATAHGGPVEIVRDRETGLLVTPRTPQAIADGVLELIADPGRMAAYGKAARARAVEHYAIERTVDRLQLLYDEVIAARCAA